MSDVETPQFPCYDPVIAMTEGDFMPSYEQASEQPLSQYEIDDAETERLLGIPLPKNRRIPLAYEEEVLTDIAEGTRTPLDYVVLRARTIYSVVSNIPESNGLTIEDYFQIGCEAAVHCALNQFEDAHTPPAQRLYYAVQAAVETKVKGDWSAEPVAEAEGAVDRGDHLNDMLRKIDGRAARFVVGRLAHLINRDRQVMELRYGLLGAGPLTLDEIAKHPKINRSRERVRQIETRSIRKIRAVIPESHFLRIPLPLEDSRPSDQETYAARVQQEKAAGEAQKQRNRRAAEDIFLARFEGDPETATRQEMLIGGLAEIVMETLRESQRRRSGIGRNEPFGLDNLRYNIINKIGEGYDAIRKGELIRSLNLLSDRELISWTESDRYSGDFVQITPQYTLPTEPA
jgi:hypothetical protein